MIESAFHISKAFNPWGSDILKAPFRPTDLSGCVLWLRSDLGTTKDGSNRVATWADQSGEGNNVTQGTDANKPVWTANQLNGQPGLVFVAASQQFLGKTTAGSILSTVAGDDLPFTAFVAIKFTAKPTGQTPFDWTVPDTTAPLLEFYMGRNAAGDWCLVKRDNASNIVILYTSNVDCGITPHYASLVHTGVATSIWQDGIKYLDAGAQDVGTCSNLSEFWVGARDVNGTMADFMGATLFEIIIYNTAFSDVNRQTVEAYLASRYGL